MPEEIAYNGILQELNILQNQLAAANADIIRLEQQNATLRADIDMYISRKYASEDQQIQLIAEQDRVHQALLAFPNPHDVQFSAAQQAEYDRLIEENYELQMEINATATSIGLMTAIISRDEQQETANETEIGIIQRRLPGMQNQIDIKETQLRSAEQALMRCENP